MQESQDKIGLGIDVGGTYTDAVVYALPGNRLLSKNKALTTKWDFAEGIRDALSAFEPQLLASVNQVALSSTLATNAIVENKGQKVGLLFMPPYGLFDPEDIPHEPKALIAGRLEITGVPIEPVDEPEIRRIARYMAGQLNVTAFAVSGFAGVINPEHELAVKKILSHETGLFVSCGHELSEILDFRTRANTAVMNGKIVPLLARLLSDVEDVLRGFSIRAPIAVVRGDGSLMRKEAALQKPVETVLSGPAASVAGAQHLTGRADAIVVDMGGTTTDTALLRDGRVDVNESGSNVGTQKTHVRALRIRTLGLGGDSFVFWKGEALDIGPERVISMAWAGDHIPGVDQALDYVSKHGHLYQHDTGTLQLLIHQGHAAQLALTSTERDILQALKERAFSLHELTKQIGASYWSPSLIARLEEHHLVQRCGFTPTDALNCRGDIALWNTNTSRCVCDILSARLGKKPSEVIDEVTKEVVQRFALVVLKRQLDEQIDPEDLENCQICRTITQNIFGDGSLEYDIRLKLHKPVIGIGAPVHLFLPAAAALLGAEPILPEHADVANAIGAITSKVIVRRHVEIRACQGGGFRIEGIPGLHYFRFFGEAIDFAQAELRQIVLELAARAGTVETEVAFHKQGYMHKGINGNQVNLGCSLYAELRGEPSY